MYRIIIVLLALCALFLITGDAEGAWTANTYNLTTDVPAAYGTDDFVHTKDDQYAVGYVNSDDELWVAHKPTTGGSWEYYPVSTIWEYYTLAGIRCTSNNTLVMWVSQYEVATYKGYIWVKWPGSDWDDWVGFYVDGGTGYFGLSLAINNTDDIAVTYRKTNTGYCVIFNLTSFTVTSSDTFGSGANMQVDVESNQSGDFWVLYGDAAGTHYLRDYNKSYGAISKSGYWYYPNMINLPNDRFVVVAYYSYGSSSRYIQYWYQSSHNGGFTSFIISTAPGTSSWQYPKIGIAQGSTTPWILAYNNTGNTVMSWHAASHANQATWQASQEYITTSYTIAIGTSSSVWPKVAGVSWCQPKTGQAFHMMRDEATNSMQIWTQDVTWTPDLTTDWPEITTVSLPDGTYGVYYLHVLTKSGGTAPFTWSLLSGPGWINLGASNGTLYGLPDGVGTTDVIVKLEDAIPRSDQETFPLKIVSAVVPVDEPSVSDTFIFENIGELWVLFFAIAIGAMLFKEIRDHSTGD